MHVSAPVWRVLYVPVFPNCVVRWQCVARWRPMRMLSWSTVLTVAFTFAAPATAIDWDGNQPDGDGANGTFGVANNWNPNQVTAVGDSATFNMNDTYTVTFDGNAASDEIEVLDGIVTFASDSAAQRVYTVATGAADAHISGGTLQIGTQANPIFVDLSNTSNEAQPRAHWPILRSPSRPAICCAASRSLCVWFTGAAT